MERQPFSGKIIQVLQDRYTKKRIEWGTATEESSSELILAHLKRDGVIKGVRPAYREFLDMMVKSEDNLDTKGLPDWAVRAVMITVLGLGAAEFFLTTVGVKIGPMSKIGHWKFLRISEDV